MITERKLIREYKIPCFGRVRLYQSIDSKCEDPFCVSIRPYHKRISFHFCNTEKTALESAVKEILCLLEKENNTIGSLLQQIKDSPYPLSGFEVKNTKDTAEEYIQKICDAGYLAVPEFDDFPDKIA